MSVDGTTAPQADTANELRAPRWLGVLLILWLVGVGGAGLLIWRYKRTPGPVGEVPARWPRASHLPVDSLRSQLTIFIHPRCVCSRASLAELNRLVLPLRGQVAMVVVIVLPQGAPAHWAEGDIWASARSIPGARLVSDPEGLEAQRFGAMTSGFFVLYSPDGRLLSSGGMVPARGHEGAAPGQDRVLRAVSSATLAPSSSPVFGCALASQAELALESRR